MKTRPYSIAGLMVAVAACGIGLAALREPTRTWAVVMRTLSVVLILGAAIGAFARRGRTRYAWAGFAVFGLFGFGPQTLLTVQLDLAPEYVLSLVGDAEPWLTPMRDPVFQRFTRRNRIRGDLGAIVFGLLGAAVGAFVYRENGTDGKTSADQVH